LYKKVLTNDDIRVIYIYLYVYITRN
jgi:hypothetical protein